MNLNKPNTRGEEKLIEETFELAKKVHDLAHKNQLPSTQIRLKDGYVFIQIHRQGYFIRVGKRKIAKVRGITTNNNHLFKVEREDLDTANSILAQVVEGI